MIRLVKRRTIHCLPIADDPPCHAAMPSRGDRHLASLLGALDFDHAFYETDLAPFRRCRVGALVMGWVRFLMLFFVQDLRSAVLLASTLLRDGVRLILGQWDTVLYVQYCRGQQKSGT